MNTYVVRTLAFLILIQPTYGLTANEFLTGSGNPFSAVSLKPVVAKDFALVDVDSIKTMKDLRDYTVWSMVKYEEALTGLAEKVQGLKGSDANAEAIVAAAILAAQNDIMAIGTTYEEVIIRFYGDFQSPNPVFKMDQKSPYIGNYKTMQFVVPMQNMVTKFGSDVYNALDEYSEAIFVSELSLSRLRQTTQLHIYAATSYGQSMTLAMKSFGPTPDMDEDRLKAAVEKINSESQRIFAGLHPQLVAEIAKDPQFLSDDKRIQSVIDAITVNFNRNSEAVLGIREISRSLQDVPADVLTMELALDQKAGKISMLETQKNSVEAQLIATKEAYDSENERYLAMTEVVRESEEGTILKQQLDSMKKTIDQTNQVLQQVIEALETVKSE